jgi:E3 ubiquitin-protein ligase MGRN1
LIIEDVDSAPVVEEIIDTDSEECVICLTDPKEVAVYPCRHMCMCITCADALPSGNNKCPLCRREAFMLIKYVNMYIWCILSK